MSQLLIQQYLNQLATLKKVSGTSRETVVREAFKDLLKGWARSHDLVFVPEHKIETKTKDRRFVDGALLHTLRVPFGYWEAKDSDDDLDAEIAKKFRAGYPKTNIVFDDSTQAILIQHGQEVMRCAVDDVAGLEKLLKLFFAYERPEIEAFRKAVVQFKVDLPAVVEGLREMIDLAHTREPTFREASGEFLAHAVEAINPNLTAADVREMLIQHVLTGEVFAAVFPGTTYHEDNNIAIELHKLEATFFTGNTKHQTLKGLAPYYAAIRKTATEIATHHDKQTFLKAIYENFYKIYNRKAADRLGVVYTPNEIVRFMIEGADSLCEKHFGRNLINKGVDILDPATGTGTFICELLEHFRGQPAKLKHKYLHELHANEVAILPYYVANLNVEATYAAISGDYLEFPNLCFVDTLDNTSGLAKHVGHMDDMFGGVTDENVGRIRRQNGRRISVIIGNPPYNANQLNENENNKNREYPEIDKRIKATYIAASTAQKTKLYDMYARFLRWASDRVDENGIVAFVSNSSFVDSRTFDGFRKTVAKEFNEISIIDLKGNARTSGERRRQEGGNIFDDQIRVGVAVYFLVRKKGVKGCRIFYQAVRDYAKADEKRDFLTGTALPNRALSQLHPDASGNWINLSDNDYQSLLPMAAKSVKALATSGQARGRCVFSFFTNGVNTARDEWVYDFDSKSLLRKAGILVSVYRTEQAIARRRRKVDPAKIDKTIKWSAGLLGRLLREDAQSPSRALIIDTLYRPFVGKRYYSDRLFSDRLTSGHEIVFGPNLSNANPAFAVTASGSSKSFSALAVACLADWHFLGDTQIYSRYRNDQGAQRENITDWALEQFRKKYTPGRKTIARTITKDAIFHYVYAVLHDPIYREKYSQNLRREFPRVPLYADFWKWTDWGKELMHMHIGYKSVEPAKLKRIDKLDKKLNDGGMAPRVMLKADRKTGHILLDSQTTITGIPPVAWEYKLGNRSALEWILDQYKESKPRDPTIRERLDTYRFADYKEIVIDLLMRVTSLSVRTVAIVNSMKQAAR